MVRVVENDVFFRQKTSRTSSGTIPSFDSGEESVNLSTKNSFESEEGIDNTASYLLEYSKCSAVELTPGLQHLEKTVDQQRAQIENLEQALRDKAAALDNEHKSNRENLSQLEKDCEFRLSAKEEEIASLEATLSGYVKGDHFEALDDDIEHNSDLVRENQSLRRKVEELEKDCGELTDENLELLFKLKSFEESKAENLPIREGIEKFEDAIAGFDQCRRSELALHEKLRQLESAKEELETEVSEMKKQNEGLEKKVFKLDEELKSLKEKDTNKGSKSRDSQDQILQLAIDRDKDSGPQESRHSAGPKHHSVSSTKPSTKARNERTKASVEAELRDLKERYLHMSLKYAEVESEREDLVMKLKACKGGKRWFF